MSEPVQKGFFAFRGASLIQVLEVNVCEGSGIEGDPYRLVVYYVRPDGTILASRDDWKGAQT